MAECRVARDYFLWTLSVIYLFAFGSVYHQIPGLFGVKGVLPIHLILRRGDKSFKQCFAERPTILCIAPDIGLEPQSLMEILCLAGIVVSFLGILSHRNRTSISFAFLWAGYYSVYQVGQVFMWFQWDILLLEVGFLAILIAPFTFYKRKEHVSYHHDMITFWLIRWLFFRFMFSSGVVKLTSQCPTWWGLTALQYHFESQCIPTPLAWFIHHFPKWFLRLGVVATFLIEIPIPFLFFAPLKSLVTFAFIVQTIFQFTIIITGNYNFFNFLTIALSLSLLDDNYFGVFYEYQLEMPRWERSWIIRNLVELIKKMFEWAVCFGLLYWTTALFSLQALPNFTIESKIAFTYNSFIKNLDKALVFSIWMGILSLSYVILRAIYRSFKLEIGYYAKIRQALSCVFFGFIAFGMFGLSLIPHTIVHEGTNSRIWPILRQWHDATDRLHIVNAYGLFRRMTGIGGRPEIIIEGSHHIDGGWQEYEFLYKPGRVDMSPPVLVPHQPRLDWQMWFAALGKYNHNPWFVNLVYRLLHNQRSVVKLLNHNPFVGTPPKFVRATLFTFKFSPWELKKRQRLSHERNWWKRKKIGTYLPPFTKENSTLLQYLKNVGLWENKAPGQRTKSLFIRRLLRYFREFACTVSAVSFLWSLFFAALTIRTFTGSDCIPLRSIDDIPIIIPNPKPLPPATTGAIENSKPEPIENNTKEALENSSPGKVEETSTDGVEDKKKK